MLFYLYIDSVLNFMQFYYHLIIHQIPSKFYTIYNYFNLIIFDRVSSDNKIT
jgi:hypothetical protein